MWSLLRYSDCMLDAYVEHAVGYRKIEDSILESAWKYSSNPATLDLHLSWNPAPKYYLVLTVCMFPHVS